MASPEEMKDVVDREGSFAIEQLDTFYIEIGDKAIWDNEEKIAQNIRSFTESMMLHQFGIEILDKLYENFTHILIRDLARQTEPNKITSIILVLRRNVRLPSP
ncbi:hypothetical protein Patl1_06551 [Pistacia atlantica]|uniref:Uncharacterized protein n=1 Tax=Pistacia atlantica TaxID=434234 RepID=A0ACC1BQW3_9ROSI|nr:hypothetical protein Patl1_06551 [Pistacia atlantica]